MQRHATPIYAASFAGITKIKMLTQTWVLVNKHGHSIIRSMDPGPRPGRPLLVRPGRLRQTEPRANHQERPPAGLPPKCWLDSHGPIFALLCYMDPRFLLVLGACLPSLLYSCRPTYLLESLPASCECASQKKMYSVLNVHFR